MELLGIPTNGIAADVGEEMVRWTWSAWKVSFPLCKFTYLLTHSMLQSPSWAANRFAASQEILPPFHGTPRFITALTSVRHLSLPWASSIKSITWHPTPYRSILILSTHLRLGLPSDLFPSGFPTKTLYTPLLSPHTRYIPSPSHSFRFYHPKNIWWSVQIINLYKPNVNYSWRTAPLTSKVSFYIFIQQI